MANVIKNNLTEKELEFCNYWKKNVLTNPTSVESWKLDAAAKIIGRRRTGTCPSCNHTDAVNMNNLYQQLRPSYESYLNMKNIEKDIRYKADELVDKFETEVKKEKKIWQKKKKE